jgi:hypothetical protein
VILLSVSVELGNEIFDIEKDLLIDSLHFNIIVN